MRFVAMVRATRDTEAGVPPDEKSLTEMMAFNEEMAKAGVLLAAEGLQPSSKGARVRFSRGKRTVVEGPFADVKELIAGFWVIEARSKEEALDWIRRCPDPFPGGEGEVEIRQVFEASDFAASDPTGEIRKREEELRTALESRPGA